MWVSRRADLRTPHCFRCYDHRTVGANRSFCLESKARSISGCGHAPRPRGWRQTATRQSPRRLTCGLRLKTSHVGISASFNVARRNCRRENEPPLQSKRSRYATVDRVTEFMRLRGPLAGDPRAQMLHAMVVLLAVWTAFAFVSTARLAPTFFRLGCSILLSWKLVWRSHWCCFGSGICGGPVWFI